MNKHTAIMATYPTAVIIRGDDAFDVNGNSVIYDIAVVQAYIDANVYKEQRAKAYPSIPDQLDLIYHNGLDAWKTAINAVKQEYPKP